MDFHLIVPGIPRSKKTSNRIVRFGPRREFVKILPSAAHEEWFDAAMKYVPLMHAQIREMKIGLPITGPVHVRAIIYRDAERGDILGYLQALSDFLQEPTYHKVTGKMARNGAGIIRDDNQIVSWDGSRLAKDAANPRIELDIDIYQNVLPLWTGVGEFAAREAGKL